MKGTMKAVRLYAEWDPKPDFVLGAKDIEGRQTYLGSKVWRHPQMKLEQIDIPQPGPGQVLIQLKACGICGSDVHMAQPDDDGYIWYPGLTGFPCTLGHELSGIVVEAGPGAYDKRTNRPFKGGEWVCAEEMLRSINSGRRITTVTLSATDANTTKKAMFLTCPSRHEVNPQIQK